MQRLLSALMGPVFAKEIVEITRRKRYFVNRVLYGAALLCALLVVLRSHPMMPLLTVLSRRPGGSCASIQMR